MQDDIVDVLLCSCVDMFICYHYQTGSVASKDGFGLDQRSQRLVKVNL